MAPSSSSKRWLLGGITVLGIIACLVWGMFRANPQGQSDRAVAAGKRVVWAYRIAKITGKTDWLDRMEKERANIAGLSAETRIPFYTTILSNCDLFAATSLHFVDVVGGDAAALKAHLQALRNRPEFAKLGVERRKRIDFWAEHLVQ